MTSIAWPLSLGKLLNSFKFHHVFTSSAVEHDNIVDHLWYAVYPHDGETQAFLTLIS